MVLITDNNEYYNYDAKNAQYIEPIPGPGKENDLSPIFPSS